MRSVSEDETPTFGVKPRRRCVAVLALILVALSGRVPGIAQVRGEAGGEFVVVTFGGSDQFLDPYRYGIYCSSWNLLAQGVPVRTAPPEFVVREYRSAMQDWMTNPSHPHGRRAGDFVLYLKAGTTFHVLYRIPAPDDLQIDRYKVLVDSGPYQGRACWTAYM